MYLRMITNELQRGGGIIENRHGGVGLSALCTFPREKSSVFSCSAGVLGCRKAAQLACVSPAGVSMQKGCTGLSAQKGCTGAKCGKVICVERLHRKEVGE